MNIGPDIQAEMLFQSFKATSVVPEFPAEPPPTPGDLVRGVATEINATREEEITAASERGQALWELKPQPKEDTQ